MKTIAALLLLAPAAWADQPAREKPWQVSSKSGTFTLERQPWVRLTRGEAEVLKARLAPFHQRLKRVRPMTTEIRGPPLSDDEQREVETLTSMLRVGGAPRLSLHSEGKVLWSIAAGGLPTSRGLVSDDGRRAVVVEDWMSTMGSKSRLPEYAALVILGQQGEVIRAYDLAQLVPEASRDGLRFSRSHVQWLEDLSLDTERDELTVRIHQGGQAPPSYKAPAGLVRKLSLNNGLFLD